MADREQQADRGRWLRARVLPTADPRVRRSLNRPITTRTRRLDMPGLLIRLKPVPPASGCTPGDGESPVSAVVAWRAAASRSPASPAPPALVERAARSKTARLRRRGPSSRSSSPGPCQPAPQGETAPRTVLPPAPNTGLRYRSAAAAPSSSSTARSKDIEEPGVPKPGNSPNRAKLSGRGHRSQLAAGRGALHQGSPSLPGNLQADARIMQCRIDPEKLVPLLLAPCRVNAGHGQGNRRSSGTRPRNVGGRSVGHGAGGRDSPDPINVCAAQHEQKSRPLLPPWRWRWPRPPLCFKTDGIQFGPDWPSRGKAFQPSPSAAARPPWFCCLVC